MTDKLRDENTSEVAAPKVNALGRRARLRDFQAQLMERMQAAKAGSLTRANQLGVLIGKGRYLIDLKEAGEIVAAGNMTKVPLTKDWYLGVSNVRGSLTSVIDFSRFGGGEPTAVESSCRVLAFSNALSFNSGLLVTKVLGLRNVDDMQLIEADDAASGKPWLLNRFVDADGNDWWQLSLALLVQDQDFLHIGL
ncbi:chemotaxis protein CheW [Undibacterium cyanobacteriorum]|uniref:Chemotaxis protein CheW n=1 Tax=Undibacterium cyanobacteriorum TaxID=3073561 RepID=A0ABY9RDY9_9BURK|nr:chemotaxis protein CheW [Undibacterium sp. 20NA77.5]WMW79447.1 chemotaxis protein CheW [Undibacterium sp. 20NA77.5]